jgi:hypothetical protein
MPTTTRHGQPKNPAPAAAAPVQPAKRYPTITVRLSTFGPGRSWPSDNNSTNSRSVSQRCCSTSPRRAQNNAPPKADKLMREKVTKSASLLTRGLCVSVCFIVFSLPCGDTFVACGFSVLIPAAHPLSGSAQTKPGLRSLRRSDATVTILKSLAQAGQFEY